MRCTRARNFAAEIMNLPTKLLMEESYNLVLSLTKVSRRLCASRR